MQEPKPKLDWTLFLHHDSTLFVTRLLDPGGDLFGV
jgi:hypothetical protein